MKVSVLIPIYNVSAYLKRFLDSLWAQTYKDVEYVFMDDCSTDQSYSILQSNLEGKSSCRLLQHEKNQGLAQTRDDLLREAEGEFICCIDSDDWLEPDYLEKLVEAATDDVDIVQCGYYEELKNTDRIKIIPDALYHYNRQNETSITRKNTYRNFTLLFDEAGKIMLELKLLTRYIDAFDQMVFIFEKYLFHGLISKSIALYSNLYHLWRKYTNMYTKNELRFWFEEIRMRISPLILMISVVLYLMSCSKSPYEGKEMVVICVPVYGQSFALGEEAELVTDFDSLAQRCGHRVLTQRLDEDFGYFDNSAFKQELKRLLRYKKRQYELSIYGMAEEFFLHNTNDSLLLCTFPGGQGETSITGMMPGSKPYIKFLDEIRKAHDKAISKGWKFYMPAFCWMQGENDIVWQTSKDYKKDLEDWYKQFCLDVKAITGQKENPICICYQSNCISLSKLPVADTIYNRPEMYVPNAQYQLIRANIDFMASGPSYPYHVVNERIHIDGEGQQSIGRLAGLTLWRIINKQNSDGLQLSDYSVDENVIALKFNVPYPPLCLDTVTVKDPGNYGFSIITPEGKDICDGVVLKNDSTVLLYYTGNISDAYVRYAVNGTVGKNGNLSGARGCLRDSQTANHNWAYQFSKRIRN